VTRDPDARQRKSRSSAYYYHCHHDLYQQTDELSWRAAAGSCPRALGRSPLLFAILIGSIQFQPIKDDLSWLFGYSNIVYE
jgi:hypothetical protein